MKNILCSFIHYKCSLIRFVKIAVSVHISTEKIELEFTKIIFVSIFPRSQSLCLSKKYPKDFLYREVLSFGRKEKKSLKEISRGKSYLSDGRYSSLTRIIWIAHEYMVHQVTAYWSQWGHNFSKTVRWDLQNPGYYKSAATRKPLISKM